MNCKLKINSKYKTNNKLMLEFYGFWFIVTYFDERLLTSDQDKALTNNVQYYF